MPSAPIPENDAARVDALNGYSLLDTLPERCYDDATSLATYICGMPVSLISLVDENRQWFKSRIGFSPSETDRESSSARIP